LQQAVGDWIQSGQPIDDLVKQLEPLYGSVRAEMIAVTEATSAFANGNDVAWLESGVVEEFDIETAEDESVCPICNEKKDNGPYKIGDPNGQPSFHTRCRCWKRPIVKGMP
jgi:SPP1 gp7 family putative phage head morphogenesis protein